MYHVSLAHLSMSMFSIEVISQTLVILYHISKKFPLNTFGEVVALCGGNLGVLLCFFLFSASHKMASLLSLISPAILAVSIAFAAL